jgi:hypothetical protein
MSGYRRQQQHVVNGRLVAGSGWDPKRCLGVAAVCLSLWFSNPANTSYYADMSDDWITNYGFFSVLEYGDRIAFSILTFPVNCRFSNRPQDDVCTALRDILAHQKPLLWDPDDRAHTVHRFFVAFLLLGALVAACRRPSSRLSTDHRLNAFLSMWVHTPQRPLMGLLWCLLTANVLLAPIWKVLCDIVPLQDKSSWFRLFSPTYPLADIVVSVLAIVLLAVGVNAAGNYWTNGLYLLRFEGILAVALGYYRGILGSAPFSLSLLHTVLPYIVPASVSVNAMTWTLLVACATQESPTAAAAFFLANLAGAHLGQYQYRHLGVNAAFQKVAEGFQQLFGQLFGSGGGI